MANSKWQIVNGKILACIFFGLFLFSSIIFLIHFAIVGKAVYGDGKYYYSYLPTLLISHTLSFAQAFKHTDIPTWFTTPLGLPANVYPIGPALFWSIPYVLFFLVGLLFRTSSPYALWLQIPVGIWTIFLSTLGLFFLYKSLTHFFSKNISLLTALTTFFATNLLFYGAIDVINSHAITFFLSASFLYLFLRKPSLTNSFLKGLVIGLLMLVRPQEIVFLVLLLPLLLQKKYQYFLLSLVVSLLVFFPQILMWQYEWGTWTTNPYLHVGTFHFLQPAIWGVLFNHDDGLFLWTPVVMVALCGLILFSIKKKNIGIPLLLVFLGELSIVASWSIWWEGASYSGRMFVSSLPFLSIGLGYLYTKKIFFYLKYFFLIFFSLLNMLLIVYFLLQH